MGDNGYDYPDKIGALIAAALRESSTDLVRLWLERISARVAVSPHRIFPTEELLNHVPILIDGIADYVESPHVELDAELPVAAKAMELGALRHSQGFDAYEILKELEILGGILFAFVERMAVAESAPVQSHDFLVCWHRIGHAIELIRQATMTHFLRLSAQRVNERETRLRRFNRMVSHELKNRVGAIRGAANLLREDWLDQTERVRFQNMILENSEELERTLRNLESLSRLETDSRLSRNVLLPQATAEAARQLRKPADAKGVEIAIDDDLPPVEVDAAAVELCLVNYLSNAIKYSDPAKSHRWVRVEGSFQLRADGGKLIVRVRDNGLGVPKGAREKLFDRFYRAHSETITEAEGTGLGLSIVRETAESFGGEAWAEFPDTGETVFAFSFPSRREEDAAAAGTRRVEEVVS
ncbi:MAG: ATP-binding protein [Gemmatimonadaceae bacterium]